jgi:DNA end-binding protein Ku
MANAIWKGHIAFGLVSIPIALYSAEKRTELHFHLLDSRDQARVRYERVNDETGKEVPWDKVIKAFEFDKNNYVVLSNDDFKRAAPTATKRIDIENFVNVDDINPVYFDRPYYLVPDKVGEKGYVLLRETLQETKKVGIAKVVIREKQYLAALMPMSHALVLNLLRFKQELLSISEFPMPDQALKTYHIAASELKMAEQLVASMTQAWQPEIYHDDYRESLLTWIEEKATQGKVKKPKEKIEEQASAKTIDFMAALKKSLENTKKAPAKRQSIKVIPSNFKYSKTK